MLKVILLVYSLITDFGEQKCGWCGAGDCSPTCDYCIIAGCYCSGPPSVSLSVSGPDSKGKIKVSASGSSVQPSDKCPPGLPPAAVVSAAGVGGGCSDSSSGGGASCSYEINACTLGPGEYTVSASTMDVRCCCWCSDPPGAQEKITVKGDPVVYIHHQEWTSVLNPNGKKVKINDFDAENLEGLTEKANQVTTDELFNIIEDGYTYDSQGNVVPYHYVTKFDYNCSHKVTKIIDPRGNETGFSYEPYTDKLLSMTDALGHTTYYQNHDANKNPGRIIDVNGNATDFTYDSQSRVLSIAQLGAGPNNTDLITEFHYSGNNLDWVKLPKGNVVDYNYDADNRLISIIRRRGPTQTSQAIESIVYQYDSNGNRIREEYRQGDVTGPIKRFTDFAYTDTQIAGAYRLWKVFNPNAPAKYTEFFYDSKGNRIKMIDDNFNVTEYLPDNLNRLIKVTQWLNETQYALTEYQYNENDDLTQVKDAKNNLTDYLYDDMGRLVKAESPDTGVTRYWYDPAGNLIGKVDAEGRRIEYSYDALNRLTEIKDTTNPASPVTLVTYYYDGANPHGISVSNGIGRLTGMSDSSGIVTWSYDIRGNIIEERRTVGTQTFTTSYTYDANGNILSITYPDGRLVEYIYSSTDVDRVAEIRTTVAGVTTTVVSNVQYEPFGDIKLMTYGNNTNLSISRDLRYQITGITLTGTSGDIINRTYTLDNAGNITAITDNLDASRSQTFGYDNFYRLTSATGPYGNIAYSYDLVGNRLQQIKPEKTIDYFYNSGTNQLSMFTDPLNKNADRNKLRQDYMRLINDLRHIIEDEWDRNCVRNNPKKTCWAYVSFMSRVSEVLNASGVDTGAFLGLFVGNRTIQDNLTQLLDRVNERTPFALIDDEDARLYRNILDEMNQVVVHSPDLKPKDPTLVYDANGNIIEESVSGTKLIYDSLGRLIRVADINDADIATYTYDATNKRVSKTAFGITTVFVYDIFGNLIGEYTPDGTLIRDYVYLGNKPIALITIPGTQIGPIGCPSICTISGGKLTAGTAVNGLLYFSPFIFLLCWRIFRKRRYSALYAGLLTIIIVVILILVAKKAMAQSQQEQIYYYHTDHLGTPIMLTDSAQAVAWDATYEPFGKASITTASITNNLRFPGQYYDAETGLHYNWHRYYWPDVGRYAEADLFGPGGHMDPNRSDIPTFFAEDDIIEGELLPFPQSLNIYVYASNKPLMIADIYGLFSYGGKNTKPPNPETQMMIQCIESCLGQTLVVTGGSECTSSGQHVPGGVVGSKHCTGNAADFGFNSNPGLNNLKKRFMCCAKQCGAGFAQQEPRNGHFHVQRGAGKGGSSGELPSCGCQ
jgi:RHS repeat-associated protein